MKDQAGGSKPERRYHEPQFKKDLIAQSLVAGASVAAIAMNAGVNANLLFKWRRLHILGVARAMPKPSKLLPVCVIPEIGSTFPTDPIAPVKRAAVANISSTPSGVIEIEIAGAQLRLRGAVDETALSTVLRALRQSA